MTQLIDYDTIISRLKQQQLWTFPGGVHPKEEKTLSNGTPLIRPSLAEAYYVPLKQHRGDEGQCLVEPDQQVLKGQALSAASHPYAVPVHAPTSGRVEWINDHVSAHPSGIPERTIKIVPDGNDQWCQLTTHSDYSKLAKSEIVEIICDAGITGLGGAGFPTHIKANSSKPIEFLIINGIECEPYITADDRLMREHAWQIRQGIDILTHIMQPKFVIIGIEENKPQAIEAMKIACQQMEHCMVISVPTVYPSGGEKQLLQILTGREVPRDGLPEDVGAAMFNVGTCFAIADAICHGKPLIERVVTLTGAGLSQPQNVWAAIGTPVAHLVQHGGIQTPDDKPSRIIMGGPMMGVALEDDQAPVVKITNCLLVPNDVELRQGENERPCIRCSACADACPASLLPQQLYWYSKAKELAKAQDYNLFDCIECGACAYVCPSDIPLVQYYRQAKSAIRNEQDEKNKSERAKSRFESRKLRLEKEKQEREARHKKAAEARLASQAKTDTSVAAAAAVARAKAKATQNSAGDKKAEVAAAVARARAKAEANAKPQAPDDKMPIDVPATSPVEQATPSATTTPDDDKKVQVAAAIARAKAKAKARQQATNTEQTASQEDEKKAKVAAAIARAKAKAKAKNAENAEADDNNQGSEQQ